MLFISCYAQFINEFYHRYVCRVCSLVATEASKLYRASWNVSQEKRENCRKVDLKRMKHYKSGHQSLFMKNSKSNRKEGTKSPSVSLCFRGMKEGGGRELTRTGEQGLIPVDSMGRSDYLATLVESPGPHN